MPITTTLNGVAFALDTVPGYTPGARVIVDASITISDANITAIDAQAGGPWTGTVTLNSVAYKLSTGEVLGTFSTPGTVSVTVASLQRSASAGNRLIRGQIASLLPGGALYSGTAFCTAFRSVGSSVISDEGATTPTGNPGGLYARYYNNLDLVGLPAYEGEEVPALELGMSEPPHPGVNPDFSARWTGFFRVPTTGKWRFIVYADNACRLYLNGQLALDRWLDNPGFQSSTGYVDYTAGVDYPIWLEFYDSGSFAALRVQWQQLVGGVPGPLIAVPGSALYASLPEAPAEPLPLQFRHFVETANRY
jgi:hypothetical protein